MLTKKVTAKAGLCLLFILTASGCASVAITAGGIIAGAGVNHTLSGTAYKTFTAPLKQVQIATIQSLELMHIDLTDMNETNEGWKITGSTDKREIDVQLEVISSNASRMRVVVIKRDALTRDSSTAAEIIIQTANKLEQVQLISYNN